MVIIVSIDMGRVGMGRVGMVLDLMAEFVMGRVCQGPSLSWAEFVMGRDVPESNTSVSFQKRFHSTLVQMTGTG